MKKRKTIFLVALCSLFLFTCLALSSCTLDESPMYNSYRVTFNVNNDETFIIESSLETGTVAKPQTPIRVGYTFIEWYDSVDCITEFKFDSIVESDLVVYAKWSENSSSSNSNRVHFEGNKNTSGSMADIEAEIDSVIGLPKNSFSRVGYFFIGWSETASGTVKNTDGGWFYMENQCVVTLFACWQANIYTVNFDFQGGLSEAANVIATYNDHLPSLGIPIKEGFIFEGYYSKENGNGDRYYDASMQGCRVYSLTSGIILYAHWRESNAILSFDGNGSTSGATENIEMQIMGEVILPICGYSRTGYIFMGWNTKSNGSGEFYSVGDVFIVPIGGGAIVFYAEWTAIRYDIAFDNNNGGERFITEHIYFESKTLAANSFTRYGYTFVSWNDSQDGTGLSYQNEQSVLNLCSVQNDRVVLYAIWAPVTVRVNFNKMSGDNGSNSVDVTFGANFPMAAAPSRVGYSFGGYYEKSNGRGSQYLDFSMRSVNVSDIGDSNTEIFACWIPSANLLMLEPNGGIGDAITIDTSTEAVVNLQSYCFVKVGYIFRGYSVLADGSGNCYLPSDSYTVPASNASVKLYAIWTPREVVISFNANGGTSGETSSFNALCDKEIIMPSCGYVKTGCRFAGWTKDINSSQVFNPYDRFTVPATDDTNMEFFAHWEIIKYSITYQLNGGTNSNYNPIEYNYFSNSIALRNPSRSGFVFEGWKEGSGIPTNSLGNKTFIAEWSIITYRITYIFNATNVFNANPETYTVLSDTIELVNPRHATKQFEGWREGSMIESGSIGDKTFTAQWNDPTYYLAYSLDGGQNGGGNPGSFTAESSTIVLRDATKRGYKFVGWTCAEMNITSPTKGITIPAGSSGDKTFLAHWEIVVYKVTYVLNEGTNSPQNPSSYTFIDNDIVLEDPIRTGHIFAGWSEGVVIEQGTFGDLTFTAVWSAISYSLYIFDGVGGEPKSISYSIESGEIKIIVVIDTLSGAEYRIVSKKDSQLISIDNKGYHLAGWYEGEDDTQSVAIFTILEGSTGDRFIMPKWEVIEYTVEYILNGGTNHTDNPLVYTIESSGIILGEPKKEGYFFSGWEDENGMIVYSLPLGSYGNKAFNAKWTPREYSITYDLGGADVDNDPANLSTYTIENETVTFLEPTRLGYKFLCWQSNDGIVITTIEKGSYGDMHLIAQWEFAEVTTPPNNI